MKLWTIPISALLVVATQFVAHAAARDQFNQKDAVTIDPQKSYIFFRARGKMELQFLREVTAEERAAWNAARAEALARARERYERQAVNYRRAVENCRGRPEPCLLMDRPEPVTEQNFAFTPPERDNIVSMRRGPQFSRGAGDDYTFLLAVPPGTYAFYGPVTNGGNGFVGFCMCMGSLRFEARAGQIVDLGEISYPQVRELNARATRPGAPAVPSAEIRPYDPAMPRPARLAGLPVVPAAFRAADKMPNYFGILIDRHPPVPGVLRYQRDRVIDERTGGDPAPGPGAR